MCVAVNVMMIRQLFPSAGNFRLDPKNRLPLPQPALSARRYTAYQKCGANEGVDHFCFLLSY